MKIPYVVLAANLVIIAAAQELSSASRLICYYCRDSRAQKNNTCLNMPTDTSDYTMACATKFCYIKRVQNTKTGDLLLLERGCVVAVDAGISTAGDTTTYVRKCNSTLCNDWDGVTDRYPAHTNTGTFVTSGVNGDDSVVILAPGEGRGGSSPAPGLQPTLVLLLLAVAPLV